MQLLVADVVKDVTVWGRANSGLRFGVVNVRLQQNGRVVLVRLASPSVQIYGVIIVHSPFRRMRGDIGVVRKLVKLFFTCALHVGLWNSLDPICNVRVVGTRQELSVLLVIQHEVETNFISIVIVRLVILKGSASKRVAIARI